MEDKIYNPKSDEKFGYMYHVEIYEEMLLTYEQALERENGSVCTSDPDDNTDYEAMKWYKGGSTSWAEKDWNKLIFGIRRHFKMKGPLLEQKGDFNNHYFYYFGTDFRLKEPVLKRAHLWVRHSSTMSFDQEKMAKHLLPVKRI